MERGEVAVQEAYFHVANLHLNLLEHIAVLLEVLKILNTHIESRKVAEHAQGMIRRKVWVAKENV